MQLKKGACLFLLLSFLLPCASDLKAQIRDSSYAEEGIIFVAKPRISPYFSARYLYTVHNTPIAYKRRFSIRFSSHRSDTLDRAKLDLVNPVKGDLSEILSRRVRYTFGKADTPFVDSVRIYFHLNKLGKVTKLFLENKDPLRDSVLMKDWAPKRAHDCVELELWKLFDGFIKDQTADQTELSKVNGLWFPGGYRKHAREGPGLTDVNNSATYKQDFSCALTIIISSSPQTSRQKTTGIRFVEGDAQFGLTDSIPGKQKDPHK